MKILFLDIDGVLNSEASFRYEVRRKNQRVSETLSQIACSNLQYILEQDSSIKLVISSTWRKVFTMVQLQNILNGYGVEAARVVGKTPLTFSGDRAHEIRLWLEDNPNVTKFVVLDDDPGVLTIKETSFGNAQGYVFLTTGEDGLLFKQAKAIAKVFRGEK